MTLILIWTTGAAVAAYAFAIAYGGSRWSGKTRERVAQMQAERVTPMTTRYTPSRSWGSPPLCSAIFKPR